MVDAFVNRLMLYGNATRIVLRLWVSFYFTVQLCRIRHTVWRTIRAAMPYNEKQNP